MNTIWIMIGGVAFTFLMAILGAALVYCFKGEISLKAKTAVFGLSSGIMLAASVWSLLIPAMIQSENNYGRWSFVVILFGILIGSCVLHAFGNVDIKGGMLSTENRRARKLFLSMTLHNIPEGLSVGFALGVALSLSNSVAYMSALGLAFGVGLQNLPESLAVALPIKTVTGSKKKALLLTLVSSIIEPIFAVGGYFFAAHLEIVQPWLLAFAGGAMLYVIFDELLGECLTDSSGFGSWMVLLGFTFMTLIECL